MNQKVNAEEFFKMTGRQPIQDDLERCNCPKAGDLGHFSCGICKEHNLPVFQCPTCFSNPSAQRR